MILALFTKGKKTIACVMLALIYFETVVPSYAIGAARPMRHSNERIMVSSERRSESKPIGAVNPAAAAVPASAVVPAAAAVSVPKVWPAVTSGKRKTEDLGGPTQPEMQAFHSVNGDNMVDLFSGDFSYNIPLIDVGGYPLAIGYNSGISMDQEASWVGLGWNINPGTITRNMRGVPDDFNANDTITKASRIKENKTTGVSAGFDVELAGMPLNKAKSLSDSLVKLSLSFGGSLGLFRNTYKGWGIEYGFNTSVNAGKAGMGGLTSGLSITNNSQEGVSITPAFSVYSSVKADINEKAFNGSMSISSTYNSRAGLKGLQFSTGIRESKIAKDIQNDGSPEFHNSTNSSTFGSYFSFAYPSYTPTITLPYTSTSVTVTLKAGIETKVVHPNFFISGYVSKQEIEKGDRRRSMRPYGYLNYQDAVGNAGALLDFNREKDMPYREKPQVEHIAIPSYTYDLFSMSGEGTGGMFRAYRGDIGYVHDHTMRTKDRSQRYSADVGFGDLVHGGVDLNFTRAFTQTGPWVESNPLASVINFKKSDAAFEAVYFRNPGEKSVNSNAFYDAIGGDDLVSADIYQPGLSLLTNSTHRLNRYKNGRLDSKIALSPSTAYKKERDKRTQVISYLTAKEASEAGLSKYIENYAVNKYTVRNCNNAIPQTELDTLGVGLRGYYYWTKWWDSQILFSKTDPWLRFTGWWDFNTGKPDWFTQEIKEGFSVRWEGRIKAPVSGSYTFMTDSDDGSLFRINGLTLMDYMGPHTRDPAHPFIGDPVNLVGGQVYNVQVGYNNYSRFAEMFLNWRYPGETWQTIPTESLYLPPQADTFIAVKDTLFKEERVNSFRKENHISEIDVLNADGRRYVYGIPVYNLKQKEATFSVDASDGNVKEGLVKYTPGVDDNENADSKKGIDHYFSGEEVSAYAHSFLLTAILSSDYTDLTGDGISPDDPGDAIKLNYSKVAGIRNPYKWRAPYTDSATYNEGLKTDTRDDRGSYVYGEKELWYLNSIESKNMIATFKLGDRKDLLPIDDKGQKQGGAARKLEEINLYTKADFIKYGVKAVPIKTVHFEYSYELCRQVKKVGNEVVADTGKLTLKKIWFSYNGNNKGQKNPYVFRYNKKNPFYNTKSYDRWGNYKDPLQNPGSTAQNVVSNADYSYALQDSTLAAENAAAWTLDSITLPSGGRIKVEYESDDYAYVQNKRAMQFFQVAGFSAAPPDSLIDLSNKMYGDDDYRYVAINVPDKVNSTQELMYKYLDGIEKIHFRLHVKMPTDRNGSGSEYVPVYARIDPSEAGFFNGGKTIWVKLKGINAGGEDGSYSPLAQSAIQFLKLNLQSKAQPGSDVGDDMDMATAVKVLFSTADNIMNMVTGFNDAARNKGWAKEADLSRTLARLNSPRFKKLGGGLRVKRLLIYDHWNAMTKQKESVYGQEYKYTTIQEVGGKNMEISSGVASYEPMLGGEENSWHLPIEQQNVQVGPLAPVSMGYTEEPLGESFFPAASVGYSKVRVRSIHAKNTRSANGFQETRFYTTYDFPVIVEKTTLDDQSKKRYRPALANFLKINAKHYLTITQGFKIELNDMNGKVRSQASYSESNDKVPLSYTENFYRVGSQNLSGKLLDNTVMVINPQGVINPAASIGKDIELMMDMREQRSVTNGNNYNVNGDFFSFSFPPVFLIPSLLSLFQREENLFRSAGATKVINRHGILDSVVVSEKGSKVATHNLLYDSETGEPVLTSTTNEFNDTIFHFTYPSGWAYDGMSGAYKNIGISFDHIQMRDGKIISGLSAADVNTYFTGGDELLIWSRQKTGGLDNCNPEIATWPNSGKLWAVDANAMNGGSPDIYFMGRDGVPFTGNDMTMKVIRSGRKNINATVGAVNMLKNPLVKSVVNGKDTWSLVINEDARVIDASATEFQQFWKVADKKKRTYVTNCAPVSYEAYIGNQACLPVPFVNQEITKVFTKNDCDSSGVPSTFEYTVPEGYYRSFASQAAADSMARADLDSNGQQYANAYGTCTFYNVTVKKDFKKNDCPGDTLNDDCGTSGAVSSVTYTVPAHKYSSTTSQAEADSLALADLNANGQAYANSVGFCTFWNYEQAWAFTRNNCTGGTTVIYTVPQGTYSSTVNQETADSLAMADINRNGQDYANRYGGCGDYTYVKLSMINRQTINGNVYETMFFRFFADEDCTVPKTVTNLRVNWIESRINCNNTVPVKTTSYTDCSGSTFTGQQQLVNQDDGIHCWIWDYDLTVGDGYVPK